MPGAHNSMDFVHSVSHDYSRVQSKTGTMFSVRSAAALRAMARFSISYVQDHAEALAKSDLEGVGLPAETPTLAPARAPPQTEFDY